MQSVQSKLDPVAAASDAIHAAFGTAGLLEPAAKWALLGFPRHSNVGDSAIWLGSVALLSGILDSPPALVSLEGEHPADIMEIEADAPIFLHGGGNFGDLWPGFHEFRIQILKKLVGRRIIQLPQTVHYTSSICLKEMSAAISAHGDFTLFVRDRQSLSVAQRNFDCPTYLCPDMAFGLGQMSARTQGKAPIFSLLRSDREKRGAEGPVGDWVGPKWSLPWYERLVVSAGRRGTWAKNALMPYVSNLLQKKARKEVERGLDILNTGNIVVTDRLHAHILCVLMGKPHVVLDNSYGKVFNYISTWPDDGLTCVAATLEDVKTQVAQLLAARSETSIGDSSLPDGRK
jgi:pyruvyl transferase EpsO